MNEHEEALFTGRVQRLGSRYPVMSIELTERLLIDAGGWQAAKHARALVDSGRVISAVYQPPLLKGVVRDGGLELRAGLKITTKTNIENICTCRESREWGTICAHSLALGFSILKARGGEPTPPSQPPAAKPLSQETGPFFSTEQGEMVTLSVVFPPNWAAGWERGNVTVGIEVERGGRRSLLNTLDAQGRFRCTEADLRLIAKLREMDAFTGMLTLPKGKMLSLLEGLQGHPRVSLGRTTPVYISEAPLLPELHTSLNRQGQLSLRVEWPSGGELLIDSGKAWRASKEEKGLTLAPVSPGLPPAYFELLRRDIVLPAEQAAGFMATELPAMKSWFTLEGGAGVSGKAAPTISVVPEPGKFVLTLEGSLNYLTARLQRVYFSGRIVTLGVTPLSENWTVADPEDSSRIFSRNTEAERGALERMRQYGFSGPDSNGQFILRGERAILSFLGEGYQRLQREWEVSLGARFEKVSQRVERVTPRVEILSSGQEWFEMQFDLSSTGGERFSTVDIQRLLQMGQNHVRLKNGNMAVFDSGLLDDFSTVLRDCNPNQQQPGRYRIGQAHAGYLEATVADAGFALQAPASWKNWAQSQRGQAELRPVELGDLAPVLRPYQKHGASWLQFLASNRLGGILADEMGLGKTLQALAFLRLQKGPSLVVCPSSLVFNWQREAARFTPERKVLVVEGTRRGALFDKIPEADLVITSYPLLRRDATKYRGFEFQSIVLDEAQHIKNPDTQNAQAAMMLKGRHRFILTGTPVENSVRDIWSLMHFVMPGYLGDRDDFRERYEIPITRHNSREALERLSKRLRPFLLRRRKHEVATDLPARLEQVAYCELNTQQKEIYSAVLKGARTKVEEARKNAGQARMLMLTALLRLRQAACDVRLLGEEEKALSGKLELFGELLQEAIDGGHKVLVFSQFVSMLTLLKEELEKSGIEYCYLDGSTRDRAEVVDRFQAGKIPVFLISLKAGGVGLNLTAADTVIHFDPWWNPAVEAQATDRAHRIGQKNVVTSYKLITRDTVEEKILQLQRKKREIIDATIENEEPLMEGLTIQEIESLIME